MGITLNGSTGITTDIDGDKSLTLNRDTSDGDIITLQKDNTTVGNIGVSTNDNIYFTGETGSTKGILLNNTALYPTETGGIATTDVLDMGSDTYRWKGLFLSRYVDLQGNRITGFKVTLADDAYAEIGVYGDLGISGGHLFVRANVVDSAYPNVGVFAHIFADYGASPSAQIVSQWSDQVTISSGGQPTGTTGTDVKLNFFFGGTNGNFYVENRLGASQTFYLSLI